MDMQGLSIISKHHPIDGLPMIEDNLRGTKEDTNMYQDHPQEPQMPRYNPPPAIPQAKVPDAQTLAKLQLTQQIQTLLLQAQERRLLNPLDLVNTNQISILSKLSEIVLTTELDIATQLAIAQQLKEIGNAVIKPVINAEPIGLGGLSQATSDLLAGVAMPSSSAIANSSNTLNSMSIRSVILQKIPKISLTNDDIARKQFGLAHIMLYEGLDMHCKQCGMRYFRTTDGNAKMQLHLDWHFRQNRRAKDKGRKAFSREWYQQEDEWVVERESDGKEAQAPTFFFDGKDPNETVPEVVEIPSLPVEGDKVPPCSVCNEDFEKYWDEDAEEWMIKNAVKWTESYVTALVFKINAVSALLVRKWSWQKKS
ncbi:hypothetical protein BC829DRAFT_419987 [Chytridium lagenaria]|nr:hypothetical protein BC829DRAFT_419987 [Chytridium lagenaria]